MTKHTCPNCSHTFETTKKAKPVATAQPTMVDAQGRTLYAFVANYSDGAQRTAWATFPHDEARYQAIVRKHKAANHAKLKGGNKSFYGNGQLWYAAHIDSGFR